MKWVLPTRTGSRRSAAEARHGLSPAAAQAILAEVERRYLPAKPSRAARAQFRKKLHLEELLLARACARGLEPAWEEFYTRYRARMRQAGRALMRETERGNDLADSLFGELFGLKLRDGERVSKLDAYTGLGSLEGWLCALLAQAHVDQWRRERRWVGLDANEQLLRQLAAPPAAVTPAAGARAHMEAALESVLANATPPDRLLLSLYFLDELTLAQMGGVLGVHESTVSRRLERALDRLRRQTRRELARRGLGAGAQEEALGLDPLGLRVDVRKCLRATAPPPGVPHGV